MSTIGKALSLLNHFTETRLEIRLSDMAKLANMDKATVHRHLTELKNAGILEQIGNDKLYRMGPEVLRLANLRESAVPLLDVAKSILDQLSKDRSETTHLSLLKNDVLVTVAYSYSRTHAMAIMVGDNDSHPLHATSSGLVVLAYSTAKFVDQILERPLQKYTKDTLTNPKQIRDLLQNIRQKGFSESIGGFEDNTHSIASPIFNQTGQAIGAISVTAPALRVGETERAETSKAVMKAAQDLTHQTGGSSPIQFLKSSTA